LGFRRVSFKTNFFTVGKISNEYIIKYKKISLTLIINISKPMEWEN
jgi:hypothetical protein